MQIPLLWGALWGHPPVNAQAAGINVPQCWAASAGSGPSFPKCQIWPCRVIQMFGKGGGQVPLWIVLPFSSPAAQGSSGIANPPPPRDPGHPAQWDPAPQPWMPQGRIWQRGSPLG